MDSWFVGIAAGLMLAVSMAVTVELVETGIRNNWAGASMDYLKLKAVSFFYPAPKLTKKPTARNLLNKIDSL